MPLIAQAYLGRRFGEAQELMLACKEVIPAAFPSAEHPPGDRFYFFRHTAGHADHMGNTDVLLVIQELGRESCTNTGERREATALALQYLFRGYAIVVCMPGADDTSLVDATPCFDGHQLLEMAVTRARKKIADCRSR